MPHIHELYDFTVNVLIVYDGKVLLVNHPRYDKWLPMGGHIELDEDPEDALFREIQEETGLEVEILGTKPKVVSPGTKFIRAPFYMDVHEANTPHKHISLNYFARAKSDKYTLSAEHTDIRWFTKAELDDVVYTISPSVKFLAIEALKVAQN